MQKSSSRIWLLLGVTALAVAGLFSLAIVAARTPGLAALPWLTGVFHKALVAHVDLSVLAWFLAMACLLWSTARPGCWPMVEKAAQISFGLGIALITLSPFDPGGEAMMSNYIPVIHSPVFFLGLGLMFCGTGIMTVVALLPGDNPPSFPLVSAALITLIAFAAFFWSYRQMPPVIEGEQYYEMLFWGGGHVLQFTHVQMMMICWLMLFPSTQGGRGYIALFSIGLVAALLAPVAYVLYDVASQEHRVFFTRLMIFANGVAPTLLALVLLPGRWRARNRKNALWAALFMSVLLFLYGGALGGMIEGQNVVIPAHYHGSIVGVTLAFMGAAYLLLPRLGYRDPAGWKLAYWQPVVYAAGQVMHITGLAVSGGYGVLRKTPGEIADIALSTKIVLGFMGLGGLIAIIGGLMFVVVMGRAVFRKTNAA